MHYNLTFVASQCVKTEQLYMRKDAESRALCSYTNLSVMLIILMWVEIGSCWAQRG